MSGADSDNRDRNEDYLGSTVLRGFVTLWLHDLGSKMAMGDQHYAPVNTQHVVVLFERPARQYKEIGLVSSLGGWFASDGDNYHKMQMAAAALGADAAALKSNGPF